MKIEAFCLSKLLVLAWSLKKLKALDEFVLEVESKALIKFYSLCIELFWSNNNQITVIDGFFFPSGLYNSLGTEEIFFLVACTFLVDFDGWCSSSSLISKLLYCLQLCLSFICSVSLGCWRGRGRGRGGGWRESTWNWAQLSTTYIARSVSPFSFNCSFLILTLQLLQYKILARGHVT